jgi:GTP diphosphokinase / guanosine-3',5'-bis(diphosphate) 3'-diphosphatase
VARESAGKKAAPKSPVEQSSEGRRRRKTNDSTLRRQEIVQPEASPIGPILKALKFAAKKHRDQRRKGNEACPYINHLIEVAEILSCIGGIDDLATLQAAILHDTIEDTDATAVELESQFGPEVRRLVEELTDDKNLPKQERKRLQIERAPRLSSRAKLIKIADKISNIRDVTYFPPSHWPWQRRSDYLDWAEQVVAGLRGSNQSVEDLFYRTLDEGRMVLARGGH